MGVNNNIKAFNIILDECQDVSFVYPKKVLTTKYRSVKVFNMIESTMVEMVYGNMRNILNRLLLICVHDVRNVAKDGFQRD